MQLLFRLDICARHHGLLFDLMAKLIAAASLDSFDKLSLDKPMTRALRSHISLDSAGRKQCGHRKAPCGSDGEAVPGTRHDGERKKEKG